MGALIAGKTNNTVLANPTIANLNPKLLSFMAFLLRWLDFRRVCVRNAIHVGS
jgi:hypothetical protein